MAAIPSLEERGVVTPVGSDGQGPGQHLRARVSVHREGGQDRADWNALGNVQRDRWLVAADGQSEGLRNLIMGVKYVAQIERSN